MKYSITYTGTDWLLKIWEPAPITGDRELPFLYKIKLRFATEQEARQVLEHYWHLHKDVSKRELVAI